MLLEAISSDSIRVSWKVKTQNLHSVTFRNFVTEHSWESVFPTNQPPRPELRNGILRGYSISYREYDPASRHFKRWQHISVTATRDQESIVLRNLKPSAPYGVLIQAKTNAGIGPASTAPLCTTLEEGMTGNMKHIPKNNLRSIFWCILFLVYKTTVATSLASSTAATVWVHDTSLTSGTCYPAADMFLNYRSCV